MMAVWTRWITNSSWAYDQTSVERLVPQETPIEEEEIDTEVPPDIDVGWIVLSVHEYNWMYGILCEYNNRYDEYCIAAQRLGI